LVAALINSSVLIFSYCNSGKAVKYQNYTGNWKLKSKTDQRILMKSHIAPALVTPVVAEPVLKPRFLRDTAPAKGVCCLHSLIGMGEQPPKLPLPLGDQGPHPIHGTLGPPESTTQIASRLVYPFL